MREHERRFVNTILLAVMLTLTLMLLGGCTTINRAIQWGAAANDTALEASEKTMCEVASVRSVRERFSTQAEREAYNALCGNTLYVEQ